MKKKLGFIGFGLIGGSIARALKKRSEDFTIIVYTRRRNPNLDMGVKEGIIDELVYEVDESFSVCDIIFLCAPVLKNIEFLSALKSIMKPSCILTDVGSVKGNICKAAREEGLASRFIGGHPMAGSEKTGYENSTDSLLENAYYLLTPNEENRPEDVSTMRELVGLTGANCVVLDASEHDRITAAISHVPHIIAVSLVNMVRENDGEEENMKSFAAGGFKDITRIASSSPAMWQDICLANRESIQDFLLYFEEQLRNFRQMMSEGNAGGIYEEFDRAGEYRNSIPNKKSSIIARSYELYINIDDRTGAIAAIATLLSKSQISIKNIGIVHNREFEDGVLRLALYTEEDMRAADRVLARNRYTVIRRS